MRLLHRSQSILTDLTGEQFIVIARGIGVERQRGKGG